MKHSLIEAVRDLAGLELSTPWPLASASMDTDLPMDTAFAEIRWKIGKLPTAAQESSVARLIDSAYSARHSEPQVALRAALVAALASRWADETLAPLRLVALSVLANTFRIVEKPRAALRALRLARGWLEQGHIGTTPQFRALIAYFEGACYGDLRHFERALPLLYEAARLYSDAGVHRVAGQVSFSLALYYDFLGESDKALHALEKAAPALATLGDPALQLAVDHLFVSLLADLGDLHRAVHYFIHIEWMYRDINQDMLTIRGKWLKGRLALACKSKELASEAAAAALTEVRDFFVERELHYDAALAGLDLALALARCDRHDDVMRLAEDMLPVFRSQRIEREARRALLAWARAARAKGASEAATARTIDTLKEIARRPLPLA